MTKFILPALVGALLLPFASVEAKTYGGFKPGKTFSFKVKEIISSQAVGLGGVAKKAPIPNSVPKFKKGQKVKFTITAKGGLQAKGLNIPFKSDGGTSNVYTKTTRKGLKLSNDSAIVYKGAKNKPTAVALSFVRTDSSNPMQPKVNTVNYTLK